MILDYVPPTCIEALEDNNFVKFNPFVACLNFEMLNVQKLREGLIELYKCLVLKILGT